MTTKPANPLPRLTIGPGPVEGWCTEPVMLPTGWDAIEVERIWARGEPYRLIARQGDKKAKLEKHT